MKLSTKNRYGTRLMLDMAQHYQDGPIHLANVGRPIMSGVCEVQR
jgi:DNA-binding IscR family transcriptional regulator